ncbi:hypothetical protein OB920_18945 [Halobacteria archaeon HArc-gm2]|nr:hypothetical protein [Halobacteria archaeon HArc-gm2]
MTKISYEDNTLHIGSQKLDLPEEVDTIVEGNQLIVVLFAVMGKPSQIKHRNVWAFDESGEKVWEIEEESLPTAADDKQYIYLWEDDGELWAQCWHSHEHRIDWETGELIEKRHIR